MRRAAAAALLLFTLAGCSDTTTSHSVIDRHRTPRVLVIGDSNLFNTASAVDKALRDAGFEPELHGVPGDGLKDYDRFWKLQMTEYLRAKPDVIVVGLGTNDTIVASDISRFGGRLDAMMRTIGDRPVVWITHLDIRPGVPADAGATINEMIRAAKARWPNLTVLDLAPTLAAHPELLGDGLHFAGAGVRFYAREITRAVQSVIDDEQALSGRETPGLRPTAAARR